MNLPRGCVVGNAQLTRTNQGRFPRGVIFDGEGGAHDQGGEGGAYDQDGEAGGGGRP
jgi:hypothetical protein